MDGHGGGGGFFLEGAGRQGERTGDEHRAVGLVQLGERRKAITQQEPGGVHDEL